MLPVLALALAGGLVLNIMPCVLPVLALKAFSVVEHAKHDAARRRKHGLAYAAGTVSLFMVLATVVVVLKTAGKHLGWGTQFQHPPFVAAMTAIVFAFALNALGVFEIALSAQAHDGEDDKLWGSVVNGWLAAIMSTPCSAPFVGSAAAFAFAAETPGWQTIAVFGVMGLGLALPYLALTFIPAFGKVLPRPGPWMDTVKQVMGFTLLGTAIWLFRAFQYQVSPASANGFLFFLLALAVALWAGHQFGGFDRSQARQWTVRFIAALGVFLAFRTMVTFERPVLVAADTSANDDPVVKDNHIVWTAYDGDRVKREHARHRPVFLDFTAEWCASCKANEKAFIESDAVRGALERTRVLPMRVDMTNEDEKLEALLEGFYTTAKVKRSGIPAYVVVYPDGTFDLLPEIINAEMVTTALDKAAKKYPPSAFASAK